MPHISFLIFAWVACLLYGLQTVVSKVTAKYSIANPWLFNFLWNLFAVVLVIPVALYNGAGIPAVWGNLFFSALFHALVSVFFILALFRLDVSVLSPLFSIRTAFAVLLGVLFLGETITGFQYLMIAIIFICGFFVSLDERFSVKSFFTKGILFALLLMIFVPLEGLFVKKATADIGFWNTTMWSAILSQVMLLLTVPFFYRQVRSIRSKQYGSSLLIAVVGILATLTANAAYAENVGLTSAILSIPFSLILVVGLSAFRPEFLEKHTFKIYAIRLVSAAIMILAGLQLG